MSGITRRHAIALTALSQSRVWGANERLRIGAIGVGGRLRYLLDLINKINQSDTAAICDVYLPRVEQTRADRAPHSVVYSDYRALLNDKSLDAVVIASPDHWHVQMITDAVQAGKDVYCEKPVTHSIEEGERVIRLVRDSKRVVQIGTQQRSWEHFIEARERVKAGELGKVTMAQTYWYQNYKVFPLRPPIEADKLDWKQWLGSAPDQPFVPRRYANWRWFWDFGGGHLTDLFSHWVDVVHWYFGVDQPLSARAVGGTYVLKDLQCPDTIDAAFEYPGELVTTYNGTIIGAVDDGGLILRGTDGVMRLTRDGYEIFIEPPTTRPPYTPKVAVRSKEDGAIAHLRNFIDCVKSRKEPNAPIEAGVAAARAAHIGNREYRKFKEPTAL